MKPEGAQTSTALADDLDVIDKQSLCVNSDILGAKGMVPIMSQKSFLSINQPV